MKNVTSQTTSLWQGTIEPEIVQKAQKGDQAAFKKLYEFYLPAAYQLAMRMSHTTRELAEEIVQESFVRAFFKIKHFTGGSQLGTWLYRICFNEAMRKLQKEKRHWHDVPFDEQLGSGIKKDPTAGIDVSRALAKLPKHKRAILLMHHVQGLTDKEIALLTGKKPHAIRTMLHRIHKQLQGRMAHA